MKPTTGHEFSPPIPSSVDVAWDENEPVDQTPPPDHEGWLEAGENGWRMTRERREKWRREPKAP